MTDIVVAIAVMVTMASVSIIYLAGAVMLVRAGNLWGLVVGALAGHQSTETIKRYDLRGEGAKREAAERLHVPYMGRGIQCKRKGVTQWETKVGKRVRTRLRNRR